MSAAFALELASVSVKYGGISAGLIANLSKLAERG